LISQFFWLLNAIKSNFEGGPVVTKIWKEKWLLWGKKIRSICRIYTPVDTIPATSTALNTTHSEYCSLLASTLTTINVVV